MEYQKKTNLLDNRKNESFKFRIRNWVEIKGQIYVILVMPTYLLVKL